MRDSYFSLFLLGVIGFAIAWGFGFGCALESVGHDFEKYGLWEWRGKIYVEKKAG